MCQKCQAYGLSGISKKEIDGIRQKKTRKEKETHQYEMGVWRKVTA